jgi:hypothetical protein
MDLVKFWAFSGPCHEDCPEIEKIKKDRGWLAIWLDYALQLSRAPLPPYPPYV